MAAAAAPATATAEEDHPRLLIPGFLSIDLCNELGFIHRSCATAGYRPGVLSTTLAHLAATGCGHLILPFVSIRERVKEAVEQAFDCHFELFVEFTGLISWCKGASIGWHSDDNKPYLKQRDYTAVCYLNNHGTDFKGGLLRFQDGEPSSVIPVAGDVVIYTADKRNVHCVDEVMEGERLTLTLWFTRDSTFEEDPKLLNLLSQIRQEPKPGLPVPAPDNMYWFSLNGSGFDIRYARIRHLGFSIHPASCHTDDLARSGGDTLSVGDDTHLELLSEPVYIGRGDTAFDAKFVNSLHALQVVQFYKWKGSELPKMGSVGCNSKCSKSNSSGSSTELVLPCNHELAESIFMGLEIYRERVELCFNWDDFALAFAGWEQYISKLRRDLLVAIPYWSSHGTIYHVMDE